MRVNSRNPMREVGMWRGMVVFVSSGVDRVVVVVVVVAGLAVGAVSSLLVTLQGESKRNNLCEHEK